MRYYRTVGEDGPRVVAETGDGAYDLTSAKGSLTSFLDLARAAYIGDDTIDEVAERLLDRADAYAGGLDTAAIDLPLVPEETWAAGVTYQISEEAREAESQMPDMYHDVYTSHRPEVFFKGTPSRTVGPGEAVGIREDSDWDVPEPELTIVLYRGEPVGYTIGNDMSSRDIEGQNPLYLPQAKIYDRSTALGPCVTSASEIGDPHDLQMSMTIERDGEQVFEGSTSTDQMKQTCENITEHYTRSNAVPELAALMTGTSIVPPDDFTLAAGDHVTIEVEGIGTLENDVRMV